MLGIAWGIVTVVLLMAYGTGFQRAIMYGFRNAFSEGTVLVSGGQTSVQAGGERSGRRIVLRQDDVEALKDLGSLKFISPEYMESLPISYGTRQTTAGVRGVSPDYGIMRTETAETGRFLNADDIENRRRVCFLGYEVAQRLFSSIPPVGETVRINGRSFEVIGVMNYTSDLQIGGRIAAVGQRLLDSVGKTMTRQALDNLSRALESRLSR